MSDSEDDILPCMIDIPPTAPEYKASFEWKMAWHNHDKYAAATRDTFRSKLEDAVPHLERRYKRGESRIRKNFTAALLNTGYNGRRKYPADPKKTRALNFYARTPDQEKDE